MMWYARFDCDPTRAKRGARGDWPFGEFAWGTKRPRGGWGGRMFGQGDLKIAILQLLEEKPRHGYEIIKAIEEKSGGAYAPSPGAVYPTLTLLEEMGHATSQEIDGKKIFTISDAGRAFLAENRSTADDVFDRIGDIGATVFSEGMREVGRAFSHIARATFGASREHLHTGETPKRILEVLEKASREIEEILREARGKPGRRDEGTAPTG
jgi:DNA-binding PadR family transcriptional regulator